MRIIRGSHRGRQIVPPKNLPVRPTTDYAKEGLFNILEHRYEFEGLMVLDLFAGTGSISYEFASRGCGEILSVDNNSACVDFINKTAKQLNFSNLSAVRYDVFKFLAKNSRTYHIVFADPPYNLANLADLPDLALKAGMLHPEGLFILEHGSDYDFSSRPFFLKQKKYGEVNFSFFEFSQET
jgi:16S rRNA (guanine966-N2)-methyltransferase